MVEPLHILVTKPWKEEPLSHGLTPKKLLYECDFLMYLYKKSGVAAQRSESIGEGSSSTFPVLQSRGPVSVLEAPWEGMTEKGVWRSGFWSVVWRGIAHLGLDFGGGGGGGGVLFTLFLSFEHCILAGKGLMDGMGVYWVYFWPVHSDRRGDDGTGVMCEWGVSGRQVDSWLAW